MRGLFYFRDSITHGNGGPGMTGLLASVRSPAEAESMARFIEPEDPRSCANST